MAPFRCARRAGLIVMRSLLATVHRRWRFKHPRGASLLLQSRSSDLIQRGLSMMTETIDSGKESQFHPR